MNERLGYIERLVLKEKAHPSRVGFSPIGS